MQSRMDPNDARVQQFKSVFRGRIDDFALQNEDGSYKRAGRPLQDADLAAHLDGEKSVGLYLVSPGNNTTWHTVLDLDELSDEKRDALFNAAVELGIAMDAVCLEFSGSKGYHVWLRYDSPVPAAKAKRLGELIAQVADLSGAVEVFPKQAQVAEGGYGNLVKLPAGVHRKSRKRSEILYPNPDDLTRFRPTPWFVLDEILERKNGTSQRTQTAVGGPVVTTRGPLPCLAKMLEGVGEGCRDEAAFQLVLHLRRTLDQGATIAALQEWDGRNKPPQGDEWIARKVRNVWHSPAKGYGCGKGWIEPFCDRVTCPVHAKAHSDALRSADARLDEHKALMDAALPPDGFLREYVEFAADATDAPEVFHLFSGLAILAAVLGRRIYLPFGDGTLFPNVWIVLLAASSTFHKSTALSIGGRVLRHVDEQVIFPNEFTPEVLTANLSEKPTCLMFWSEMKNLLGLFERPYMAGTKELLTELYDCPDRYVRKLRGECFTIERPAVSILAATTIDWLVATMRHSDVAGGFTARFVFVPAYAKSRDVALPAPSDIHRRNELVQMLQRCSQAEGMVDISGVRPLYEEWYYKTVAELRADPNTETLAGFYTRLTVYTLKFAMLLEVSETRDILIREETMRRAFAVTDYVKTAIRYLVEREFHVDRSGRDLERIYRVIESKPGIGRRELLQAAHMLMKDCDPILATLLASGRVRVQDKGYWANGRGTVAKA